VVRVQSPPHMRFDNLLQQVRNRVLEGIEHGDFPFALLVERLQPSRDASRSPLFQIAFTWNNTGLITQAAAAAADGNGGALRPEFIDGGQQGANFDLELAFAEDGEGLSGWWRYNVDLFTSERIVAFAEQYLALLTAALDMPSTRIRDLPITAAPLTAPVIRSQHGERDPRRATLVRWFEEQVRQAPSSAAVTCDSQTLTYAALNARANQLAHVLAEHGASAEPRVAVYLDRSIDLVIAILAVLKTGAAYVPIDPVTPAERTRFIVEDAGARLIVTSSDLSSAITSPGVRALL